MAHLAFVFCCIVWGSTFILLERVTHVFGPVEIAVLRMFSGAAAVSLFWWMRNREYRWARRDWGPLFVIALIFTAPSQVIQAYVLAQGFNHSFLGSMVAAIPLLTILISVPMLGERPSARELVGVLGGLACICLLVEDSFERGMPPLLLALVFTVPLSATLSNTYIKWKLPHVPAAPLTVALLVVSALTLLPLELFPALLAKWQIAAPAEATVTPLSVFYLFLIGVVGSGISTMVFIWMVLKKGPLFAGMTTYVVPLLALLWGSFDQESISTRQLTAIAAILGMVAVVQSGARREVESAADGEIGAPDEFVVQAVPLVVLSIDPELSNLKIPAEIPESLAS